MFWLAYTSSQDYTKQEQNNEPVFSNPQINSNENIRSSENIPQFSGEIKPKVFNEPKNLNFNAFNHFSNGKIVKIHLKNA